MTREQFLAKYGPIRIAAEVDEHFARLRCPHLRADGKWDKIDRRGPPIFKGRFYNIGYFPGGCDPTQMEHDWGARDAALTLARELAAILDEAGCRSVQSEGDAPYFPFVATGDEYDHFPDPDALDADLSAELYRAYANGDIRATYEHLMDSRSLSKYGRSIFWPEDLDEPYSQDLPAAQYAAYLRVTERLRAETEEPQRIYYHPDFIEFPIVYGGVDIYDTFVGVITSAVWT